MWQDKVKEVIDILENSNVNEIEVTFWGRKIRVVKNASNIISSTSPSSNLNEIKSPNIEEKNDKIEVMKNIKNSKIYKDVLERFPDASLIDVVTKTNDKE